jgi:adenylyltransferase/sulfurtransferase
MENNNNLTLSEKEKNYYSRQILLSEMSEETQIKLKSSKVIIIGAGGLGSPCIMYLAGAGIGTIGIVDNDKVEEINLPRQVIHSTKNIGMNKALSAKEYINNLNPYIKVNIYETYISNKNGIDICKDYDVIIDCCDNPKTRYLCNDVAAILNKPFISSGTVRWDGQVGVYVKNCKGEKLPCYRCLNPNAPLKGNVKKCSQVGVIGTLPAIMGTLEANEAIKFILGKDEQILQRKIFFFDGYDNRVKIMKTRNFQDDCIVCGKNKQLNIDNISEYDYDLFLNGNNN